VVLKEEHQNEVIRPVSIHSPAQFLFLVFVSDFPHSPKLDAGCGFDDGFKSRLAIKNGFLFAIVALSLGGLSPRNGLEVKKSPVFDQNERRFTVASAARAAAVRFSTINFAKTLSRCFAIVRTLEARIIAMSPFVLP
jgi:hypothetical protein